MIWRFKFVCYFYILKPVPHEPIISSLLPSRQLRTSSRIGWMCAIVFYTIGVHQLRQTNQFGWFYATGVYSTAARQLRQSSRIRWFYATGVYSTVARQLRQSSRIGWFYATAACRAGVDKASFHATRPNRRS